MGIFRKNESRSKPDFASSVSQNLDYLLGGGFPSGVVTQIYGEAGSGKTNICMAASIKAAQIGNRVIFIDTESSFNKFRFEQIANENAAEIAKRIYLHSPRNLHDQRAAIEKLDEIVDENFSLIVVDSFVAL